MSLLITMNLQWQPSPVFIKSPVVRVNKTLLSLLCPSPLSASAETQNGHQRCCEQHAEHRREQILLQTPPPKKTLQKSPYSYKIPEGKLNKN